MTGKQSPVKAPSRKIELLPATISVCFILALSASLFIGGNDFALKIETAKVAVTEIFTPMYLWLGLIAVIFCIYFVASKYGDIRLGEGKPAYKTLPWVFMIFCSAMGSSMQYWAALEWIYYYSAPPQGVEPFSTMAAELSLTYANFHWTITPWAIYCAGFVALGIRAHVKKKKGYTLGGCIEETVGEKRLSGWLGKVINTLFICGVLAGASTFLAFGIPMLANNFSEIVGIEHTFLLEIGMILFVTLIYTVSSMFGLKNGLQNMSKWGAYGAIVLALYFLISGPTLFQIKAFTGSAAIMFQDYIHMSLWTDHVGNTGFVEAWTSFYWGWWISTAPLMWIFITKVSRGRTIREVIFAVVGCGSLGCALYFNTVGATGLYQQLNGINDYVKILAEQGDGAAITTLISSVPLGSIVLVAWFVVALCLISTTLDSNVYTIATSMTKDLKPNEDPPKVLRLFWSIFICVVPVGFLFADAPLKAVQATIMFCAVPISFIFIMAMHSSLKTVRIGYGDMSRDEIKALKGGTPAAYKDALI